MVKLASEFKQLGKIAEEERKKFASDLKFKIKDELQNLIELQRLMILKQKKLIKN